MVLRKLVSAALLLSLGSSPAAFAASVGFIHERTIVVPELTGPIKNLIVKDIDADNSPEILASDDSTVVLCSLLKDSVLFRFVADSGFLVRGIELADVDRDSVADIVIAVYHELFKWPCPIRYGCELHADWRLVSFSGSGDYIDSSIVVLPRDQWGNYRPPNALLRGVDINSDGYNELIFSFRQDYVWWDGPMSGQYTTGLTTTYFSFPDSTLAALDVPLLSLEPVQFNDSSRMTLASTFDYTAYELLGPGTSETLVKQVRMDTSGQVRDAGNSSTQILCDSAFVALPDWSESNNFDCVGDLDKDSNVERLTTYRYKLACDWLDSISYDSLCRYEMWRFVSNDSIELIWSHNCDGLELSNYLYDPHHPGNYFAFSANAFMMFRGTDGGLRTQTSPIPAGTKLWAFPYADGYARLITYTGTTVDLYRLDVSTDVSSPPEASTLPSSFELGAPYPNPFNASMSVEVMVNRRGNLKVGIFNLLGERVSTLYDHPVAVGKLKLTWDAGAVSSGIYLLRARLDDQTRSAKLLLLK